MWGMCNVTVIVCVCVLMQGESSGGIRESSSSERVSAKEERGC